MRTEKNFSKCLRPELKRKIWKMAQAFCSIEMAFRWSWAAVAKSIWCQLDRRREEKEGVRWATLAKFHHFSKPSKQSCQGYIFIPSSQMRKLKLRQLKGLVWATQLIQIIICSFGVQIQHSFHHGQKASLTQNKFVVCIPFQRRLPPHIPAGPPEYC